MRARIDAYVRLTGLQRARDEMGSLKQNRWTQACVMLGGLVACLFPSLTAEARGFRQGQVPNGNNAGCILCHTGSGGPRNAFGMQIESTLVGDDANWGAVFDLDADGDGFSNGEELGDPNGTWIVGEDNPSVRWTFPGDSESFPLPCGNGVIEPEEGEECDGAMLNGTTCQDLGFLDGELRCSPICGFDTSLCTSCGDGVRDEGENCDGDDLGGLSCGELGFGSGELSCNADCTFNEAACSDCGNGLIDGAESCDGGDLGGQTCETRGFDGGALVCSSECSFDTTSCTGDPDQLCGDGVAEGFEECDGEDLQGFTCESIGFAQGTLSCSVDCALDASRCDTCGDGIKNGVEECDGDDVGGVTCEGEGFRFGEVGCWDNCTLDTTDCSNIPTGETGGTSTGGTSTGGTSTSGTGTSTTSNGTGGETSGGETTSETTSEPPASGGGGGDDGGCSVLSPKHAKGPWSGGFFVLLLGIFWVRRRVI